MFTRQGKPHVTNPSRARKQAGLGVREITPKFRLLITNALLFLIKKLLINKMNLSLPFLIEFRKRALHTFFFFLLIFGIGFIFSDPLLHFYLHPLQHLLAAPQHLIATQITTPLITPLNVAVNIALFVSTPFAVWQIWRFAAPALFKSERFKLGFLLSGSVSLFALGCLFCYFFILPFMFKCFIHALPKEVLLLPDISFATQFITQILIIFGCSFQIPLIFLLLIHFNLMTVAQCQALRPYIIVAAFILGMLLTPHDVTAQILLALPLWGLFELGLVIARISTKQSVN